MVASLYVNREVYMVLANYNHKPVEVVTADNYISVTNQNQPIQNSFNIGGRTLEILKMVKSDAQ